MHQGQVEIGCVVSHRMDQLGIGMIVTKNRPACVE